MSENLKAAAYSAGLSDRDKRKIRPFVEDLLNKMNIETLQIKLIKFSLVLIIILIFVSIMSFLI
jgi:hypothetical protein